MKLFYKIYFFLMLLLILVLGGYGYMGYRQEVAQFDSDMKKDALLLGKALTGMAEHAWKNSGPKMAIKLIGDANAKEKSIEIRWVDFGNPSETFAPKVPVEKLGRVLQGETESIIMQKADGEEFRVTYVPARTDAQGRCAVELSESLSMLKEYTRTSLLRLFITAAILFVASGALHWFHFRKWIHQPLVGFIEKSIRIGKGDLSPDLDVRGDDEFAELAQTLNSMCEELQASREALIVENERRIEALEQLRHAERLATLGRLSAGMAHELGTPLNVISGRAKLIRTGGLEEKDIDECARIVGEQAERITKIMHGLLNFSRRKKLARSPQDMEALVNRVLEMLGQTAQKAKVSFQVVRNGEIPPIPVDPLQIQQVVTNLVNNGIQAMDAGGVLEVELAVEEKQRPCSTGPEEKYLAVRVKDQGPGIPAENWEHLFEPFYTTKEVGSGTGLGLSIAYGIVQEHGGWIDVESEPGKGACFTINLPMEDFE